MLLTSLQNPKIKAALKLHEDARARRETGLFYLEGAREMTRALTCHYEPVQLFVCEEFLSPESQGILTSVAKGDGLWIYEVTPEIYGKLAVRGEKDGLIGLFRQKDHSLSSLTWTDHPLVLAIHGIEKPGNLGALIRSADGAGATATVFLDGVKDLYNPHTIRGSVGTLFHGQKALTDSATWVQACRTRGVQLVAAALSEKSIPHFEADFTRPSAILVGSEAFGLPVDLIQAADTVVKIPMMGLADSLNVSVAGAVLLYEALRQRAAAPRLGPFSALTPDRGQR